MSDFIDSLQNADVRDLNFWPSWLKVLVAIAVGLVILLVGYFVFFSLNNDQYIAAQQREIELKNTYRAKKEIAINLPAYQQQMGQIQDQFSLVLQKLPNQTEVPALLSDLSQAAVVRGLDIKQFKPLKAERKDFYMRMPIEIKAVGTYHQLAYFLSDVANFQRVVTIGDFSLVRVSDGSDLEFSGQIITYHYTDPKIDGTNVTVDTVPRSVVQ